MAFSAVYLAMKMNKQKYQNYKEIFSIIKPERAETLIKECALFMVDFSDEIKKDKETLSFQNKLKKRLDSVKLALKSKEDGKLDDFEFFF